MIKQIELDKTNTLNTIETKLRNIESKISATPDAVCENAEIIKLQEDLFMACQDGQYYFTSLYIMYISQM